MTMPVKWLAVLHREMLGRTARIVRRDVDWAVEVSGGPIVSLPVPWRIVANGGIALAGRDDGHQFGLPAPLDGETEANALIAGQAISDVAIDDETADLTINFEGGVRLDAFHNSSGHEGWQIMLPSQDDRVLIIALGGGDIAIC